MKILNWYVTKSFLVAFFMSILILTFCMAGARLIPVLEFVARGVPISAFAKFLLYSTPIVLTFTIPLSVLVAIMLVFGRLSADSEITAMRACGISILQLMSPIMIITVLLTCVCLYLQVEMGPPMLERMRSLFDDTAVENPGSFFQPGTSVQFGGNSIMIDDIAEESSGRMKMTGIQVWRADGDELTDFSADSGYIDVNRDTEEFIITLINPRAYINGNVDDIRAIPDENAAESNFVFTYNYGQERNSRRIAQRPKFMTLKDVMAAIRIARLSSGNRYSKDVCEIEVELNQRIAFALAPIAFLLLGVPLALHTSRRETSVGLFIGALAGGFFFLSIILCESLTEFPNIYPQYLLWLPNLGYQAVGAFMVYRISRR
ncbi:MAG: LptF/LptG family permease [Victivallaceae bacterium]|nr:LptF/LptG family permease [Victivallaceae bacterium]